MNRLRPVPFLTGFGVTAILAAAVFAFLHSRPPVTSLPPAAASPLPSSSVSAPPVSYPWEQQTSAPDRASAALAMAVEKAPGDNPPAEAKLAATLVLSKLTLADLPAAGKLLDEGSLPGREWMLQALMILWAEKDGTAAMDFARAVKVDYDYKRQTYCGDIAAAWAFRDPAGLMAWKDAHKNERIPGVENFQLAQYIALRDPAAAAKILCAQKGLSLSFSTQVASGIKTAEDLRAVRAVLEQHPFPPANISVQNGQVLRSTQGSSARAIQLEVESRWPLVDPEGWSAFLRTHPVSADGYDLNISESAPRLSSAPDPNAAADKLLREADKVPRAAAVEQIVSTWAKEDLNAAGAWLNTQPFGADTVPAINAFARQALQEDPAAAFKWLESIPDPAWRESSVAWLYENWHQRDSAAAAAWLDTASWTPERQRSVTELLATRIPTGSTGSF